MSCGQVVFFATCGLFFGGLCVLAVGLLGNDFEVRQSCAVVGLCLAHGAVQWLMVKWQLRRCLVDDSGTVKNWWVWAEVREFQQELASLQFLTQSNMLRLLSNLSHELNTNLNAITGAAQMIGGQDDKEMARVIVHASHVMANLVTDFTDLYECTQQQLTLNQQPFLLSSLV
eukprot:RCo001832